MILFDKVNVGFSLRALGSVNTRPDGTIEVLAPIKPKYVMGLIKYKKLQEKIPAAEFRRPINLYQLAYN